MDWVRSCYRSKWRLTRGSDRLRAGFYYFAAPGTPHYPGLHNLGSRDWVSDERDPEPPLGEYSGERQWYRGDPPAVVPRAAFVGSADCIKNGELPGLPIISPRSARCAQMLPDLCYLSSEILRQKTNTENCLWAWKCIQIIAIAYDNSGDAVSVVREYFGLTAHIQFFESTGDLFPAYVVCTIDDVCIVWITGTTNLTQGALQALHFGFGPINHGPYNCSTIYELAAILVMSQVATFPGAADCTRFICCGHSYGAAVAYVLAAKLKIANAERRVEMVTFGMPQPGGSALRAVVDGLRQVHYVNEHDPIPYLPPRGLDFFGLLTLLTVPWRFEWQQFVRPSDTMVITEAGKLELVGETDFPTDTVSAIVLAIINATDVPAFQHHTSRGYLFGLQAACPCLPAIPPPTAQFRVTVTGYQDVTLGPPNPPDTAITLDHFGAPIEGWSESDGLGTFFQILLNEPGNIYAGSVLHTSYDFLGSVGSFGFDWVMPEFFWNGGLFLNPTVDPILAGDNLLVASIRIERIEI